MEKVKRLSISLICIRLFATASAFVIFLILSALAFAADFGPKVRDYPQTVDMGVSVQTRLPHIVSTDLSIGPHDALSQIKVTRLPADSAEYYNSFGTTWKASYENKLMCVLTDEDLSVDPTGNTCQYHAVSILTLSGIHVFDFGYTKDDWSYFQNRFGDGTFLRLNQSSGDFLYEFYDADGSIVQFNIAQITPVAQNRCGRDIGFGTCYYGNKIIYKNGESLTFTFEKAWGNSTIYRSRIKNIISNRGFGIKLSYMQSSTSNEVAKTLFVSTVTSFKRICVSGTCADTNIANCSYVYTDLPSSSPTNILAYITKYIDAKSNSTTYNYTTPAGLGAFSKFVQSINLPQNPTINVFNNTIESPTSGAIIANITAQKDAFLHNTTFSYSSNNPLSYNMSITISSKTRVYTINPATPPDTWGNINGTVVTAIQNELGEITNYSYDYFGRLTSIRFPEGNSEIYELSNINNINKKIIRSKTSLLSPDIEELYSYQDCEADLRFCHLIKDVTDPRGAITNYSWNNYGQIANITGPADISGNAPVTSYTYAVITTDSGELLRLVSTETRKISPAKNTITKYEYYGAQGYFSIKEKILDFGGDNIRTCFSYDDTGNIISETRPNGALTSCPA